MGKVLEYLKGVFGCNLESRNTTVTLSTSAIQIAPNNADRFTLTVVNMGATIAYIAPHGAPSSTSGIMLAANGGQVGFTARDDGEITTFPWYAVAASGTPAVLILETVAR